MMKALPTVSRIRELLEYDPTSGEFRWRVSRSSVRAGARAGSLEGDGYWQIAIDGTAYKAHRLAWAHYYGVHPTGQVDHRDRDRLNNAITNLRAANHTQNCCNSRARSSSGFKGVSFDRERGKWFASITIDGIQKNLGRYTSPEQAARAYDAAAIAAWGDFAAPNFPREEAS